MASGGKAKAVSGGAEAVKRRKVGFSADIAPLSCDANECLKLHIVFAAQDLQGDEYSSDPEFSERIFGEDGKIYGFNGLKIDLWMHATTFNTLAEIRYKSKSAGGKEPCTDVLAKLKEVFGDGLTEDRDSFLQSLLTYSHNFQQMLKEHGEVVSFWRSSTPVTNEHDTDARSNREAPEELKQIVRLELTDPAVRAWHAHLTPLALLFIEGAQPIQSDDPLWEIYLALEGEGPLMKVVGFCNVYRFYHYPDSTRLRISQILVLPLYQGHGFGMHLLKVVNTAASVRGCYDVTMEEPSVVLQKLRDTMDVLRLLSLPSLNAAIEDTMRRLHGKKGLELSGNEAEVSSDKGGALININGNKEDDPSQSQRQRFKEKSVLVPPTHLVEEVRKQFQISKVQFRRCWEQLLFVYLDPKDTALQDVFQEAVVQRLNVEIFEKENGNRSVGKRVVNTDNEFDNSKTFVMTRSKKILPASGNGCSVAPLQESNVADEAAALTPAPEEKGKVLQQELKEREEELLGVAQAVARHSGTLGLTIPLLKMWGQELPATS